ncbi:hypothetical protein Taro_002344 [Colocasia esculenta]|uniref:Histone H4 n=1 Tax=Colocasia esculenta TaxID=4460 RepID=A0A843TIF8_COLES|nr:hypothetical protein [Colocasia esculenta]
MEAMEEEVVETPNTQVRMMVAELLAVGEAMDEGALAAEEEGVPEVVEEEGVMRPRIHWPLVIAAYQGLLDFQRERVRVMGFGQILEIEPFYMDSPLVQALIERWDLVSRAFLMPWGHMVPSLDDVARIIDLRVDEVRPDALPLAQRWLPMVMAAAFSLQLDTLCHDIQDFPALFVSQGDWEEDEGEGQGLRLRFPDQYADWPWGGYLVESNAVDSYLQRYQEVYGECDFMRPARGITKPAIRCLARRGGVKHISGLIYEETHGVLKIFLENVIRDAVTYMEHAHHKTVTPMDVVYILKCQGRTLYGFGG